MPELVHSMSNDICCLKAGFKRKQKHWTHETFLTKTSKSENMKLLQKTKHKLEMSKQTKKKVITTNNPLEYSKQDTNVMQKTGDD